MDLVQTVMRDVTVALTPVLVSALIALAGLAMQRLHLSTQTAAILKDTAFQANLEKHAMDVALQVEEHFASILKANPEAAVNAQNKADLFAANLVARVPGVTHDEAIRIAQATLPKIGAGAAATLDRFLTAAATTSGTPAASHP